MSSGCGDVLSLEDFKTAKKHKTFESEVITGRAGGVASGAEIDTATNAVTGQVQKTMPAILRDIGFTPVSWDFSTGGTLTVNDRDKVVYDPVSQTWYSYTGTLPVVVPASFNPVGNADWKPQTDPFLRDELASTSGAGMIGLPTSGTIDDAIKYFTPEMFGAAADYNAAVDDCGFVQAAIDAAAVRGIKYVILSRFYQINSKPHDFITPGDDGTVYPDWVTAGTDEDIDAETTYSLPCSLKIPSGIYLVGYNRKTCGFIGDWDPDAGVVAIESGGGLYFTTGRKSSTITWGLKELTLKNFFIGYISEGIGHNTEMENCIITSCGISGIEQGAENCTKKHISLGSNWSGIAVGGWWNYRSRVQSSSIAMPPYPATDVYLCGWIDAYNIEDIDYSVRVAEWGDTHAAIDTFFDTYFYKNANSALTSAGGRASNTDLGYNIAVFTEFRGICSRAISLLNRYGRNISNASIWKAKTLYTHRAPFYTCESNRCHLDNVFIERSGYVNPSTLTGSFGVTVSDVWGGDFTLPPTVAEGFIVGPQLTLTSVVTGNRPPVPGGYKFYNRSPTLDSATDKAGAQSYLRHEVYMNSDYGYETILDRVRTVGENGGSKDIYVKTLSYDQMPAALFINSNSSNNVKFEYYEGTFTPTLTVGTTAVTLAVAKGTYQRYGSLVKCWVNIFVNSVDLSTLSGILTIGGLPFSLENLDSASGYPAVIPCVLPTTVSGVSGGLSGATLTLRKNNGRSNLQASDLISASTAQLVFSIEYTVSRNLV